MTDRPFIYHRGAVGNIRPKAGDASIELYLASAGEFTIEQIEKAKRALAENDAELEPAKEPIAP
jgi:hypothetical protein